jgi:exopolysaccharide biosynthesis protein
MKLKQESTAKRFVPKSFCFNLQAGEDYICCSGLRKYENKKKNKKKTIDSLPRIHVYESKISSPWGKEGRMRQALGRN